MIANLGQSVLWGGITSATLILILTTLFARALRRAPASARHLVWFVGLMATAVPPVVSRILPRWSIDLPRATPFVAAPVATLPQPMAPAPARATDAPAAVVSASAQQSPPASVASHTQGVAPSPRGQTLVLPTWSELAGFTWSAGFACLLLRMLLGIASLLRLGRTACRARLALVARVEHEARELGVRRAITTLLSDRRSMPMAWGVLRPTILLPIDATEWNDERTRCALRHELAHHARFDTLSTLLARLACSALWFHPLAWYALRQMQHESENACDDLALRTDIAPASYAEHLVTIATRVRSVPAVAAIAMATPSLLTPRVHAILDASRNRTPLRGGRALVLVLVVLAFAIPVGMLRARATQDAGASPTGKRKVVVLAFDGLNASLTEQLLAEGALPNLRKLADSGGYHALRTTVPAEQPASLAALQTGCNPGKTGILGWIERRLDAGGCEPEIAPDGHVRNWTDYEKTLGVRPALGSAGDTTVPATILTGRAIPGAPELLPAPLNIQKATPFWDVLDRAGLRSVCLQAPITAPAKAGPNTRLLSGLGVRDIGMSFGTWFVYTSQDFEWSRSMDTGGYLTRIKSKRGAHDGLGFESTLRGPENFFERRRYDEARSELAREGDAKARAELDRQWQKQRWATVPLVIAVAADHTSVRLTIGNETQTVTLGGWSQPFRPVFELGPEVKARGVARAHLLRCSDDDVRLYLPAIGWDPNDCWPQVGLASPPDFAHQIARQIGTFDTNPWSSGTHALKDEQITDQVLLDEIGFATQWRRELLARALEWNDWDCLYQVFLEPALVASVMQHHADPQHPRHRAEEAAELVTWLGSAVKKRDVLRQAYLEVDRTVGQVMERIASGALGVDAVLLVCSSHGYASFRREVDLNRFLVNRGYLTIPDRGWVMAADWRKTRAYAMGSNGIYLNLKGRERHWDGKEQRVVDGTVDPAQYDQVCDALIRELEALVDPATGARVVSKVYRRAEVLSGDWWKEAIAASGVVEKSGAPDLFVGFRPGYRVAWATPLGTMGDDLFADNKLAWSGDCGSVDPALIPGVLFTNRKLGGNVDPSILDIAPTIMSLLGVAAPSEVDGKSVMTP